jgi:hypothetical protein
LSIDTVSGSYDSGTRDLSDDEFVAAFEGLSLPNERFRHYDHIRLAWIMLRDTDGPVDLLPATDRIAAAIKAFGFHHSGSFDKYHDTITRSFMVLVDAHRRMTPDIHRFELFAEAHPELFDRRLLLEYYSENVLMSRAARANWVEPDIRPLPRG